MLTKLIPVDDIPTKLGQRLPRPEEKAKNIAEMERVAKLFDAAVKWVVNPSTPEGMIDATITDSDRQHPLAQERQRMYDDGPYSVTATEIMMKMQAAKTREDYCMQCDVIRGSKHFLHCKYG